MAAEVRAQLTPAPMGPDTRVLIELMRVAPWHQHGFADLRELILNEPYAAAEFWQQVGALRGEHDALDDLPPEAFAVLPGGRGIGGRNPRTDRRLVAIEGTEFQREDSACIVLRPLPSRTGGDAWTGEQLGALIDCICTVAYERIPGTAFKTSIVVRSPEEPSVIS